MPVDTLHREYLQNAPRWKMLRDVIAGEDAVKGGRESYLPRPGGRSDDEYAAYITRASFYDTTGKTVAGLVGGVFRKAPTVSLPPQIKHLEDDADGRGSHLTQLAKRAGEELFALGRCGVLVDYPAVPAEKRLDEERFMAASSRLHLYTAEDIINWRYERFGGVFRLMMVVLEERVFEIKGDPFAPVETTYRRVLSIDENGRYRVELFEEEKPDPVESYEPRLANGQPLTWIPFHFIGSTDNDGGVDKSPVYDIARVNLAHYRNSADYEDSLFMVGQPTPFLTGLPAEFIKEHQSKMVIGSRAAWMLPEGASAGMLESSTDLGALRAALEAKEAQMVALGARIVGAVSSGVEAAETVRLRSSGESNTMASVAENLSRAFNTALGWAAEWMGGSPDAVIFTVNDDFFAERLTGQDIAELMKAWQGGAITYQTLFEQLVKGEIIATGTDVEQYKTELEEEAPSLPVALDPLADPEAEDEDKDEGEEPAADEDEEEPQNG